MSENLQQIDKDREARLLGARKRIVKQLPNMYKGTRLYKYIVQENPVVQIINYDKMKGLMLNIQRRFMWYSGFKNIEDVKVLLLAKMARNATKDLSDEDRQKYFFKVYAKLVFEDENQKQFITIPLVDLNLIVV